MIIWILYDGFYMMDKLFWILYDVMDIIWITIDGWIMDINMD